jgi:hypothetical protein
LKHMLNALPLANADPSPGKAHLVVLRAVIPGACLDDRPDAFISLQCDEKYTSKQMCSRVRDSAMKSKRLVSNGHGRAAIDETTAAMERMELYCTAYPDSPSAVRRPRLMVRGQLWIALLGPSVEEGIVGIGPTVESALRAFDVQYFAGSRSRSPEIKNRRVFARSKLSAA